MATFGGTLSFLTLRCNVKSLKKQHVEERKWGGRRGGGGKTSVCGNIYSVQGFREYFLNYFISYTVSSRDNNQCKSALYEICELCMI